MSIVANRRIKDKTRGQILCEIAAEYRSYIRNREVSVIVKEASFTRFNVSTMVLNMIAGVIEMVTWDVFKGPLETITVVEVRKHVVGNPKADKDMVADGIGNYFEHPPFESDDESDACGVALGWLIREGYIDPIDPKTKGE